MCGEDTECPRCIGDIIHSSEDSTLKEQLHQCYTDADGLLFFCLLSLENYSCSNDNDDNNNNYSGDDELKYLDVL